MHTYYDPTTLGLIAYSKSATKSIFATSKAGNEVK